MKRTFLSLGLFLIFAGCATFQEKEPLPTVDRVNLDRFMGKWYVVASVPSLLDRAPHNAVQVFERANRGIQITYTFNSDQPDGELQTITSRAMVDNPGINTDWQVTTAWPIHKDMKIIYLEPDYSVAVVGHPNRNSVRILSRRPSISPPIYSDIILYLQELGFDVGDIRRIPHS